MNILFGLARTNRPIRPQWVACILLWLSATICQAHVVQQLFGKTSLEAGQWSVEITMDAGYAWPATRDDLNSPQPERTWMVDLDAASKALLCKEAEAVLRQHLEFYADNQKLLWTCQFPEFQAGGTDFPRLPGGGAFFTVQLSGKWPTGAERWWVQEKKGEPPNFMLETSPDSYVTLNVGGACNLAIGLGQSGGQIHPRALGGTWFLFQGFLHVLPFGWDHALYMVAIFLADRRVRSILAQSLCFTFAHSLTLGLAWNGIVNAPSRLVEPLVAFSIAATAAFGLWRASSETGKLRYKLCVTSLFGLVHGLAFSGALSGLAAQQPHWLKPLALTNIGVELAQLATLVSVVAVFHILPDAARLPARRLLCWALLLTGSMLGISRLLGY